MLRKIEFPIYAREDRFESSPSVKYLHELLPSDQSADFEERAIVVVLSETGLRCDNITARQVWRDVVSEVKAIIGRFERFFP